jgi:dCMP deaminase
MLEQPIKRSALEWDVFFYSIAEKVATLSKDPARKVGALLVAPDRRQLSMGYNGLPSIILDLPSLLEDKERKQGLMVHAEDNCLHQAPFDTAGCCLYVTRFPCHICAALIVAKQVARLVVPPPDFNHPRWGYSWDEANHLFRKNGIQVLLI